MPVLILTMGSFVEQSSLLERFMRFCGGWPTSINPCRTSVRETASLWKAGLGGRHRVVVARCSSSAAQKRGPRAAGHVGLSDRHNDDYLKTLERAHLVRLDLGVPWPSAEATRRFWARSVAVAAINGDSRMPKNG